MSLILEALRKSEAERRRDSTPDVALELPPPAPRASRSTPTWLWPPPTSTMSRAMGVEEVCMRWVVCQGLRGLVRLW